MSLHFQIGIRIFIIFICILILGGSIAIWQARYAVNNEVDSSIHLALQLIKLGISSNYSNKTDWLNHLSSLEQTRHLKIQLKRPSGSSINITPSTATSKQQDSPPKWFTRLVVSQYPKVEYQIAEADNNLLTLVIQANPMDEITEVWYETITFFVSILLLMLLTFLSVHLVLNKTLRDIQTIVNCLRGIETGDYQKKLPPFSTREYDSIAKAINHMTDVLDQTQKHNRALTQHSLQVQEEERQRLSQELHDEFGQYLTAIKVMATTATKDERNQPQIHASIIKICDHLMAVVRSMMKQLHPLILTELGLTATLEDLINRWKQKHPETQFNLQLDNAVDTIDLTIVIQVYRVIQEGLTNIIRHASASQVTIQLKIDSESNTLKLIIKDNGCGCHLNQIKTGFGLQGMAERIKLLGGNINFISQSEAGFLIKANIPLNQSTTHPQ